MDCSPPGSSVHGILQARILEWVVMPSSRGSSQPRDWTQVSGIAGKFFAVWVTREAQWQMKWSGLKVAQSCLTLCDYMDCSLPGSSVHRILQARILEWVAVPFSRRSSQPRNSTQVSCIAGEFFTVWATREAQSIFYASKYFQWKKVFRKICIDKITIWSQYTFLFTCTYLIYVLYSKLQKYFSFQET